MIKRNFKDNESYFKFINKYKDKINILKVIPIAKENNSKISVFYKNKE